MMKKSRLFSLFAALMMCVSLLSAVASASDGGIQPRRPSCPYGGEYEFIKIIPHDPVLIDNTSYTCAGRGAHFRDDHYRLYRCSLCGDEYEEFSHSTYRCDCKPFGCGYTCTCF